MGELPLRHPRLSNPLPCPVAAAILTLALAIGMNAGMVGLIDRALLSPPEQVADPDRVVDARLRARRRGRARADGDDVLRHLCRDPGSACRASPAPPPGSAIRPPRSIDGEQMRADAMLVSGNYFDVLGAKARARAAGAARRRSGGGGAGGRARATRSGSRRSAATGRPGPAHRRQRPRLHRLRRDAARVQRPLRRERGLWIPFAAAMRQSPGWDQQPYRRIASIVARLAPGATAAAAAAQAGRPRTARWC